MAVKRYLGLDVGEKRIGMAWGDNDVRIASPLNAVANDGSAYDSIATLAWSMGASGIVVGRPRDTKGDLTAQTLYTEEFTGELRKALKRRKYKGEIIHQDESLTSVIAEKRLKADKKHFKPSMLTDGTLDSEAATIILGDFLEGLK